MGSINSDLCNGVCFTECTHCRICETICAWSHDKGTINRAMSRLRIETHQLEWMEGETNTLVTRKICRQCPGVPSCMAVCPSSAIFRDENTGAVIINDDVCIRCGACVDACPDGAVWYNKSADVILKCDLCGGDPKCVEWCPINALKYEKIC